MKNKSTAILFSLLLAGATTLSAGTLAHWKFDSFGKGAAIDKVGSGVFQIEQSANAMRPSATDECPPGAGLMRSARFSSAREDFLAGKENVPVLDFAAGKEFTIEGWFKLGTTSGLKTIISNRGSKNTGNAGFSIYIPDGENGKLVFQVDTGGSPSSVRTAGVVPPNEWYYFAAVRTSKGLALSLYDTKERIGIWHFGGAASRGEMKSDHPVAVGKMGHMQSGYYDGLISEIKISDAALRPNQFLWKVNAGK